MFPEFDIEVRKEVLIENNLNVQNSVTELMVRYQDNETDIDDTESQYDIELDNQILEEIVLAYQKKFNLQIDFIRDTILNNLENLQEAENILIQKSVEIGASYKENVNPFDTMDEFVGANIDPESK